MSEHPLLPLLPPSYLLFPEKMELPYACGSAPDYPRGAIQLLGPGNNECVALLTDPQKEYLAIPHDKRIATFADEAFRQAMLSAGSFPKAMTLSWQCSVADVTQCWVYLSEREDFSPVIRVSVPVQERTLELRNMKIGMRYYWKVVVESGESCVESDVFSFLIESTAPRIMKIDGLKNVRDLGGRTGLGGRRLRQGLIYRTECLNPSSFQQYMTVEQIDAKAPELTALRLWHQEQLAVAEAAVEKGAEHLLVPYGLSKSWTAFVVGKPVRWQECKAFLELAEIPPSFMDVPATSVAVTNGSDLVEFAEPLEGKAAFLMQEFDAPEDGYMRIGCGADWFWCLAVNRVLQKDNFHLGNGTYPASIKNCLLDIPVKKGRNLLAVYVASGSLSWGWFCGQPEEPTSTAEVFAQIVKSERNYLSKIDKMIPAYTFPQPGKLSPQSLAYMTWNLGIRTDIDLRITKECRGMTESPLAAGARWLLCPMGSYLGMDGIGEKKAFAAIFRLFLNASNYPLLFHCHSGQDRTGVLATLLQGLLGVEDDGLYQDWEMTGFYNPDMDFCHSHRYDFFIETLNHFEGKTLAEKAEQYALASGITPEELETFRSWMLE